MVLKKVLLLCLMCGIGWPTAALAQRVYGIYQNEGDDWYLSQISMENGELLANHALSEMSTFGWQGQSAIDPVKQRIHLLGWDSESTNRLYSIDLLTGEMAHQPELNRSIGGLSWNAYDSNLYVNNWELNEAIELLSIDPVTGGLTHKQSLPGAEEVYVSANVGFSGRQVSKGRDTADALTENRLYNLNLQDSALSSNVLCDFEYPVNVSYFITNSINEDIYSFRREGNATPYSYSLVKVDEMAGQLEVINELDSIQIESNDSYMDPYSNTIGFSGKYNNDADSVYRVFTIDAETGEVLNDAKVAYRIRALEFLNINLTGLEHEVKQNSGIEVYPNPSKGHISISSPESIDKVRLYNSMGQLVGEFEFSEKEGTLSLENLPGGTYWIEAISNSGYERQSIILH